MAEDWSENVYVVQLADEPALSDELDELERKVADHPRHCVLNCEAVTFLNSSNLAQLVRLRKTLGATECRVLLCGLSDELWKTFEISGLNRIFSRSPNVPLALAELQLEATADESA